MLFSWRFGSEIILTTYTENSWHYMKWWSNNSLWILLIVVTVDMPWLEWRTLFKILKELLRGASREWKSDLGRVYTSRDTRLEPVDQTSSQCRLHYVGSQSWRQRTDRERVWGISQRIRLRRHQSCLQRFWCLRYWAAQEDLRKSFLSGAL